MHPRHQPCNCNRFDIKQAKRCEVGDKVALEDNLLVLDEGASDPRCAGLVLVGLGGVGWGARGGVGGGWSERGVTI